MKLKTIITVFTFFYAFSIKAQTIKPLENEKNLTHVHMNESNIYFKDINNIMDKYFGTWIYEDSTYYFKVTFVKKEQVRMIGNKEWYFDELVCEYQLKINGVEIYNTYGANSNISNNLANHIVGHSIESSDKINLFYGEPPVQGCMRIRTGNLNLEFLANTSGTQPQLNWTVTSHNVESSPITCDDGSELDNSDFLIPSNMILIKE
tara:strand:- start:2933 stop:3550 length:618 start_codon:yes stop_codon:yes gene_type:complete